MSQAPGNPSAQNSGRRETSVKGMVGAMLVLLVLIGAFVAGRSLLRDQPEVGPTAVDYLAAVEGAQANGVEVFYPPTLPEGWLVTSVEIPLAEGQVWRLGMLTDDGEFVGLRQETGDLQNLVRDQLGSETGLGDEVEVAGAEIERWRWVSGAPDLAGESGLGSDVSGGSLLLYGSAEGATLKALATNLTSAPRG